jgi:hypothetical protein
VEELLNQGAHIDDAIEIEQPTPLHMAAWSGHVEVMNKLIIRGANPNAFEEDDGPVISAAITSGNRAAVELLVNHGVSLTHDRTDVPSPLALAAEFSDVSMFEYLIEKFADKVPAEDYSKALVAAAQAGRIEHFNKLLTFQHSQEYKQRALNEAAEYWNWEIVTTMLATFTGLNCDTAFYQAATCTEPQDKILKVIWKYADGSLSPQTLNNSLYEATDTEKESTVRLLLDTFKLDPNATGEE